MMNKVQLYTEYCNGCGLCYEQGVRFEIDKKGFITPVLSKKDVEFCDKVCPAGGRAFSLQENSEWGIYKECFVGWSSNVEIRTKASSGGVLSALCMYLLDTGKVDGIIQTKVDEKSPIATKTTVSTCRAMVLECAGSRYTTSSPLLNIGEYIEPGKTYAFVGKPCDVSALRMLQMERQDCLSQIKYLLSFFCAGQPSRIANEKLLAQLGCENAADCSQLIYRGNGWPGFATAYKLDGTYKRLSYAESWGRILGRDIKKSCRLCADGVGEFADISCGDAWYLDKEKEPDFSEKDGRNVIFARTAQGLELIKNASNAGYMMICEYDIEELQYSQRFQFERKRNIGSQIAALRLFNKCVPLYDKRKVRVFSRRIGMKKRMRRFFGSLKRVVKGKY